MPIDKQTLSHVACVRIDRPRLEGRLCGPGRAPIAVLCGPAGSGKTELLRVVERRANAIVFRVGNERRTFARFVHGLAQAVAPVCPGPRASFSRAWERALQSHSPGSVLAHWMCEHLHGIDRHIVIDDLHDAAGDARVAAFIATFAEVRAAGPLTLAMRSTGALPIALWMATGRMERPIDDSELPFDLDEIDAAARRFGFPGDARQARALIAATGGLPIAVAYALTRYADNPRAFLQLGVPRSFDEIAARIFGRRSGHERAFLFSALCLPHLGIELLRLSGWDNAAEIQMAIGSDAPFMWASTPSGELRFHDRFRDFLAGHFATRDADFRTTIVARAIASLTTVGHHAAALEVATRHGLTPAMSGILDEHGFEILESGEIDVISETLDALDAFDHPLGARALALRGYLEARSGRFDTAEAWFRLGLSRAPDDASRVAIALYYARELALRRREDSADVLAPFAESADLPRALLVDVRSSFAQALTTTNRLDEAQARTDDILALLDAELPAALRARVYARAAYVSFESGQLALARERALIAAPLAVAHSLYDVAASTYSVLYAIAHEIDDDPVAALEYLRCVRELGVKSGTLRLDLYALVGMYELHAEAGAENALRLLDNELAAIDKHTAVAEVTDSFVPAKALQAGWAGHFADAERLLRPTAGHQPTAARKALCWAQISLYCAAAGAAADAHKAFAAATDALGEAQATTKVGLALLTLALAAWAGGNLAEARRRLDRADDAVLGSAPRLRALRTALEVMTDAAGDPAGLGARLPAALAGLREVSFGGMARLIEALPQRFGQPTQPLETIGCALAKLELPTRFAAAVAPAGAPLRAWLDSLDGVLFDRLAIGLEFERWTAGRTVPDHLCSARVAAVRRELRVYRPPAPVLLRLVDDIDVDLNALLATLDAAAPLMAEHSRAVSAWCSRLGRIMGLNEREITFVTRSGLVHDIGKMRTPPEILDAPRQLNGDEWTIMKGHAAVGGQIVGRHPRLSAFVPIVRGHHERLDGRGYPDGLRANTIPLAARIVAVADSFNAMIGRRPYRLPLSPTEALAEIDLHRSTQFDPEVVEAMVRIVLARTTP